MQNTACIIPCAVAMAPVDHDTARGHAQYVPSWAVSWLALRVAATALETSHCFLSTVFLCSHEFGIAGLYLEC